MNGFQVDAVNNALDEMRAENERLKIENERLRVALDHVVDLRAEIERLRAALQICASHSESSNFQGALSYVRKIARRALGLKP